MTDISGVFDESNEQRIRKVFQLFDKKDRPKIDEWHNTACPSCGVGAKKKVGVILNQSGTIAISPRCGCTKESIMKALRLEPHDLNPNKSAGKDGSARAQVVIGSFENVNAHIERPWLWPSYIAHGEVTILYGEEGEGKSLITCNLAAALSSGGKWPDGTPVGQPTHVFFIVTGEDGDARMKQRLLAAGADLSRVHPIETDAQRAVKASTEWRYERPPSVDSIESIAEQIGEYRKAHSCTVDLLIIDHLDDFLSVRNPNHSTEVREQLIPLSVFARATGIAVIGIRHPNKGQGLSARNRMSGSRAYGGVVRGSIFVGSDGQGRHFFFPDKIQYGPKQKGLEFNIEQVHVAEAKADIGRVVWKGPVEETANQFLARTYREHKAKLDPDKEPDEVEKAKEIIKVLMANVPIVGTDAMAQAVAMGVKEGSVYTALRELGIESKKEKTEEGMKNMWRYRDEGFASRLQKFKSSKPAEPTKADLEQARGDQLRESFRRTVGEQRQTYPKR